MLHILVGVQVVAAQSGENIALGKKCTLSPAPNYEDCTDLGDAVQLTDGKTTNDYFWTQPGTVGWKGTRYAAITVDLGQVEPIGGASFRTAAGVAGVLWPANINVLTSEDGKTYRNQGDLVALDLRRHGPWPTGYAIRRLSASDLRARGRYVRFMVTSPASQYIVCDEVEVYRGPSEWLKGPPVAAIVPGDPQQCYVQVCFQNRFEKHIAAVKAAIDAAAIQKPSVRESLSAQCAQASAALRVSTIPNEAKFRTVMPYNEAHAQLFQVQAALWKAQGRANLTCGVPVLWDPTDPWALPMTGGRIEVHTMHGEYRAAAVNLYNASAAPIEARLRFEGLHDSPAPAYVTVHEAAWTDTREGRPVLAALPLARQDAAGWRVTVLSGLARQVWFTFHVEKLPAGDYAGRFVVEGSRTGPLQTPVRLRVYPLDFPRRTTLLVGGWSDTNGAGHMGVTPQNRKAQLAHLQEHFVNAPWATKSVMLPCIFTADGAAKLDTREMDDWLAQWPNARMYCVFLSIMDAQGFGGAAMGTADFDRRVGAWISAWVRHLGAKGISTERLALLIQDEPREETKDILRPLLAWAKAVRAAEPKVRIWEDPIYRDLAQAPAALFEACDVLCPQRPQWLEAGDLFARFYRDQQRKGRTLDLYSCSGPAQLLDPYSYYRLQAWHCRQIGATGSFFWCFSDNSGASTWNPHLAAFDGPYTPHFLDNTTVTAGKQMEAIREGVEDYEYFAMLRDAVDKAKAAGRADAALSQAESLLATAADEVLAAPGASELRWHTSKNRTKADAVRIRILETLSALKQ